ncbi:MAG: hypothetical protein J1E39_02135 [Eubacterium sp.]|nr:hypothetical protein [Eubacterium sp.]
MLKWEWYDDINTKALFLHLLLTANYEQKKWRGITIERGQVVTSLRNLSDTLGVSKNTILRSLKKLESTGEVKRKATAEYTIITLNNYCRYQDVGTLTEPQEGHKRDTNGTANGTLHNKENKENNDNKGNKYARARGTDASAEFSPAPAEVTEQDLIDRYGIEATEKYKKKFQRWCEKKGVTRRECISTIAGWMESDGVKKPQEKNSSLDIAAVYKAVLDQYKTDSRKDKQ